MPRWRAHRDELNRAPLAHEEWTLLTRRNSFTVPQLGAWFGLGD